MTAAGAVGAAAAMIAGAAVAGAVATTMAGAAAGAAVLTMAAATGETIERATIIAAVRPTTRDRSRRVVGRAAGLRVVSFERTGAGVEVVYSNGVKEEIENGRLEMKDAAGRTVVERPATQRDVARLDGNLRNSGIAPAPAGSQATRVEVSGGAIEVTYATGWREELAGGRYELKDPNNNTVVQRSATAADVQRLRALAGS